MGTLGHKVFVPLVAATPTPSTVSENQPDTSNELLYFDHSGVKATRKRTSDGFVVLKGSQICSKLTKSCTDSTMRNRKKYASKVDENFILTEDILFTSPSSAASYIGGASLSGNASWRSSEGIPLKISMQNNFKPTGEFSVGFFITSILNL